MTLQCIPNVTWDDAVAQLTVHECLTMKESADAKTEKVNMLTTKPTAKHHSKPAMRCRRCNKIGHKAAQCRSKGYTGHRRSDGQPRNYREILTREVSKSLVSCQMCNALCVEDRTKHVNVLTDMILHLSVQEDLRR